MCSKTTFKSRIAVTRRNCLIGQNSNAIIIERKHYLLSPRVCLEGRGPSPLHYCTASVARFQGNHLGERLSLAPPRGILHRWQRFRIHSACTRHFSKKIPFQAAMKSKKINELENCNNGSANWIRLNMDHSPAHPGCCDWGWAEERGQHFALGVHWCYQVHY